MKEPELWSALDRHPLTLEGKVPDLERLILRHGRIGGARTRKALGEYRRFLYLAALAPKEVAAPPLLHRIWRAHARNHQGYTVDLVRGLLRRPMPEAFDPQPPLTDPLHARTHALYRAEFGIAPPRALWPGPLGIPLRRGLGWAVTGLGVGIFLALSLGEPVWAALAALGCGTAAAARHHLAPWDFSKPDDGLDLDFGTGSDEPGLSIVLDKD